jgi:hypothetical protein
MTRKITGRGRTMKRTLLMLAVVSVAAAGLAVLANGVRDAHPAFAANHCTRYAPIVSQDFNCTVSGTMYNSSSGIYETPSTALRDENTIALQASRTWEIAYYGGNYASAGGTGTTGHIYSSAGYATAACWFTGASVTGYCETLWHD